MYLNSGRLAEIMRHQAALLEHIITTQRYYPDYFRVAFYGNFPVAIRNKQFIVCYDVHRPSYGAYTDALIVSRLRVGEVRSFLRTHAW
jgi:hypothetical protein